MAWCHQTTSHHLSQCWPRSMLPSGVTRPQWFNSSCCTNFAIYMMVSCHGNAFRIVGPLWGDSLHKGPEMQSFNVSFIVNLEQIAELLVIRDIMMLMWNHCNEIKFIVLNPVNNLLRGSWWNWLCIPELLSIVCMFSAIWTSSCLKATRQQA